MECWVRRDGDAKSSAIASSTEGDRFFMENQMSDPIIQLQYDDRAVRQRLTRLQAKVGDLTPAMRNIGEALVLSTDQRFEKEISPSGEPWKPNTPFTIAKKRAEGRILKVLQSTGRGRASVTYQASRDRVVVGTNVDYMRKHQVGDKVPKREWLGVSADDKVEIIAILDQFLAE